MVLAIINMLIIIIMLQLLIFIVHFMCLMKLPIPTSLVDRSHLTRFYMERMVCFTIEQLYQWRYLTVYYRHFPPDRLKSRRYQIYSRGCWPEYWLSHTFKDLKLFHINSYQSLLSISVNCNILKLGKRSFCRDFEKFKN